MRSVLRRLLDQAGFSPRQLFAALQGAWLEPKQGLIWQENTGVTPTTTGGQTIGLLLDQSQGAVLGPELVTNGDFSNGTTGWTLGTGWSISGGAAVQSGSASLLTNSGVLVAGSFYLFTFTVTNRTAGFVFARAGSNLSSGHTNGTVSVYLQANGTTLAVQSGTSFDGTIDNISVRQILGNHAYQSTAANRPVLGRRYNLLTYSEDFSNAAWSKINSASVNSTPVTGPTGQMNAYVVTTIASANSGVERDVQVVSGVSYRMSVWAKAVSGTFGVRIGAIVGGSFTNFTLTTDWQLLTADYTAAVTGTRYFDVVSQGSAGSFIVTQADLRPTADVNKDPTYQRITTATDYDYGQYPAAIHDTNDFLSLSLPAINVRRNLLTWSEDFGNAAWTKTNVTVEQKYLLIPNNVFGQHQALFVGDTYPGQLVTMQVIAKYAGYRYINISNLSGRDATFDLVSGVVYAVGGAATASITPLFGGEYKCVVYLSTKPNIGYYVSIYNNSAASSFSGDGISGVYLKAQLELGSVATDYQKITDWTSEAFASSGSVYFSTPVGMSQLNNQSMGTAYTLPALSSDIYSWMVFPQRLNAAQESRLARYMEQRAGIAGPDYFEQVDYGPELVTNGTDWVDSNSDGVIDGLDYRGGGQASAENGKLKLLSPAGAGFAFAITLTLQVGKTYRISWYAELGTTSGLAARLYVGTEYGTPNLVSPVDTTTSGTFVRTFVATSTTALVHLQPALVWSVGVYSYFDNISVRELKDGVTGQLSDDAGDLIFTAQ